MEGLKHVMVGIDFSPRSVSAAQMAVAIAEPAGAAIELVHVVETQLSDSDAVALGRSRSGLVDLLLGEAKTALDSFSCQLAYADVTTTVATGSPALELDRLSGERRSDMLVLGDTGAGPSTPPRGVGVTAYRLVERGPRNVLVVKASHGGKAMSVAAAVSFVPVAKDVLRQAHLIARFLKADLHVVRVIPDIAELRHRLAVLPSDMERIMGDSVHHNERRLESFVGEKGIHDVVVKTTILAGKPGQALVEYLQDNDIDVVVLGTGTSYRIAGYPLGSTTHKVLNQTMSSVCVVRSLEPAP